MLPQTTEKMSAPAVNCSWNQNTCMYWILQAHNASNDRTMTVNFVRTLTNILVCMQCMFVCHKACVVTENRNPFDIVCFRFEVNDICNGPRISNMNMLLKRATEDRFEG
jgi:hypothetical protein